MYRKTPGHAQQICFCFLDYYVLVQVVIIYKQLIIYFSAIGQKGRIWIDI